MNLDVPTLGIVVLLTYWANTALSAALVLYGRHIQGGWYWVLGQGLLALAFLLQALRVIGPEWPALLVGNTLFVGAHLVIFHALWTFFEAKVFPRKIYFVLLVVLASFLVVWHQPFWIRAAVYALWSIPASFGLAWYLVLKARQEYRGAAWVTSIPFWATLVVNVGRLVANLRDQEASEFLSVTGMNAWYLVGTVLVSNLSLFGYFMMASIRSDLVLADMGREIDRRNRALSESGRAKDLFFSIIAHDLRGPIGGAARYVRKHLLGKMSGLEPKYNEVETLASALEKTNEFLEKLLWWSRAQLQDWSPSSTRLDLEKVVDQVISLHRSTAEWKEITLTADAPPYPRPWGDPDSIQIILGNLVSNAVKFSLPGKAVHLRVAANEKRCLITVADSGVGMDRSTVERLFRIEDKLTTHGTSGERGSGLGLIVCRALAERNGGGVDIYSEPGQGTEAVLWIPMDPETPPDPVLP